MERIIKCCPKCGSPIEVHYLYQYAKVVKIGKNGKLQKRHKLIDCGYEESAIACCSNKECKEYWNCEEFDIDENDRFVSYKDDAEESI